MGITPQLLIYPAGKLDALVADVEKRTEQIGLEIRDAVFLTRAGSVARKLRHVKNPDVPPAMRALAKAKGEFGGGDLTLESLRGLEALLSRLAWGIPAIDQLNEGRRLELRDRAFGLLRRLPELTGTGETWVKTARDEVAKTLVQMTDEPAKKPGDVLKALAKAKKAKMESFTIALGEKS